MRVLITGGAGFLGRHLCRRLSKEGHELVVLDLVENPEFATTIADIRDADEMKKHIKNVDVVFHLAALIQAGESVQEPQKYIDSNISGSLNVLEAMRENGVSTIIFSSTAAVYGEPEVIPITEQSVTMPINPYGMTKLAMEALVSSYVQAHQLTGIALRYFNLYGPDEHHQPETHAIPRFLSQIMNGEEVTIWGNGEHQRDYIYIDDVVEGHVSALAYAQKNAGTYSFFNLSTEQPTSVVDIVQTLEKVLNKKAQIKNHPPRPGDPLVLVASAQRAKSELGWSAKVGVEEGLTKTAAYFSKIEGK